MCHHCRAATIKLFIAALTNAEQHVNDLNAEISANMGRPYTPEEQRALGFTAQGIVLTRAIAEEFANPAHVGPKSMARAIEALLVTPATCAPVSVLVTGAKFAHYSAILLRQIAETIDLAINVRAERDNDHEAVRFIVGDVANEIEDHRRAKDFIPDRGEENDEPDLPSLGTILAAVRQAAAQRTSEKRGPAPDYRH